MTCEHYLRNVKRMNPGSEAPVFKPLCSKMESSDADEKAIN